MTEEPKRKFPKCKICGGHVDHYNPSASIILHGDCWIVYVEEA